MERTTPLTKATRAISQTAVEASKSAKVAIVRVTADVAARMTRRYPKRLSSGVVDGFAAMLPIKTKSTIVPLRIGLHPKRSWNMRGKISGTEPTTMVKGTIPRSDCANVVTRSTRRSRNGLGCRSK